jgi:hypothetical protein
MNGRFTAELQGILTSNRTSNRRRIARKTKGASTFLRGIFYYIGGRINRARQLGAGCWGGAVLTPSCRFGIRRSPSVSVGMSFCFCFSAGCINSYKISRREKMVTHTKFHGVKKWSPTQKIHGKITTHKTRRKKNTVVGRRSSRSVVVEVENVQSSTSPRGRRGRNSLIFPDE